MFDAAQFSDLIRQTIVKLNPVLHSRAANQLLLGTSAQESRFGTYLKQIQGPALGVFQMEPLTEEDIWRNYLAFRPGIENTIKALTGVMAPSSRHLQGNLLYQIAMARLHYFRVPEPLPAADDIPALAAYWKQHYNTPLGRGTEAEFVENYHRYVGV
jgi:hypothetical protein